VGLKIDHRAQKITKIVGIVFLVLVIACMLKILIWETNYYRNKSAEERSPEQTVITDLASITEPSEEAPTAEQITSYQVSSTAPRYLEIKRLDIKARVKDSNVNEHILPVPDNIYDVSWYSGSSRPGQNGNILISGIAEGTTKPGIFYNLDSLEKGDAITLERGDGERFEYSIEKISIVDKKDAKNKLPEAQKRINDKETLTLFTARRTNENDANFNSIYIIQANKK
jgi:LPXTG-site transpeptidase (sortase) family protein